MSEMLQALGEAAVTLVGSSQIQMLGEVALAMFLGGLIGVEREFADKPAGFRTHMLIAAAAALLVGLGDTLLQNYLVSIGDREIRSDPIRIVEAIITGVSVLGAGTIFRRGEIAQIQGLTTASSIILCGAIGICVALEQFTLAIGVTLLALAVLRGLKFIEAWIERRRPQQVTARESDKETGS